MRQDRRCPKCEGRQFYVAGPVGQSSNGATPLALAAAYIEVRSARSFGQGFGRVEAHIDAWICASCGFAELYARDLAKLAELHEAGAEGLSYVDAAAGPGGAFR